MKLSEACDAYLADVERGGARPRTVTAYRARLRVARELLGDRDVADLVAADVETVLDQVPPRSQSAVLKAIRGVLRALGPTAADAVRPARVDEAERKVLSGEQLKLLRQVLETRSGLASGVLLVLIASGARAGEVLAAADELVDGALLLRADGAKGRRGRRVDLPSWAWPAARRVLATVPAERPSERTIRRELTRALKATGLPQVRVHDLRRSRITELLLGGAPLALVLELAGHRSPAYLMRVYAHAAPSAEQRRGWVERG